MLLVVAVILAILAFGGGIAIHPLLFILLVAALIALVAHTRRGAVV